MHFFPVLFIAFSLAMDAFAISLSCSMKASRVPLKIALKFGLFFGGFQFLMPIIGFFSGSIFSSLVVKYCGVLTFLILALTGLKMLYEAYNGEIACEIPTETIYDIAKTDRLAMLAIATSIDAYAVGITFALDGATFFTQAVIIGVVAFVISSVGAYLGSRMLKLSPKNAEKLGGFVLIILGVYMGFYK